MCLWWLEVFPLTAVHQYSWKKSTLSCQAEDKWELTKQNSRWTETKLPVPMMTRSRDNLVIANLATAEPVLIWIGTSAKFMFLSCAKPWGWQTQCKCNVPRITPLKSQQVVVSLGTESWGKIGFSFMWAPAVELRLSATCKHQGDEHALISSGDVCYCSQFQPQPFFLSPKYKFTFCLKLSYCALGSPA